MLPKEKSKADFFRNKIMFCNGDKNSVLAFPFLLFLYCSIKLCFFFFCMNKTTRRGFFKKLIYLENNIFYLVELGSNFLLQ